MVSSTFFLCAAAAAFLSSADAFSLAGVGGGRKPTSLHMLNEPKGCASKPFEKKKIAVFGAGGYLGATVFGFFSALALCMVQGFRDNQVQELFPPHHLQRRHLTKCLDPLSNWLMPVKI